MAVENILPLIVSILSTIAAILAWIAKLKWSDEFVKAKDEIIKAKEAQISTLENEIRFLREINSPKVHEYYASVKSELEKYIDIKDQQINTTKSDLKIKEEQIIELQRLWQEQESSIDWELNSGITMTLEGMVSLLESRDRETEGHSQRVTEMTVKLAEALNLSKEQIIHIRRGALLHDIGKMNIPDEIIHKSGPLNEEEFSVMKKHPEYAYEFLKNIEYLRPAIDIPYCHHERLDGSGYPRGLKGEEIPLAARIFSVVDVWDALLSDRPYRPGLKKSQIIEHLQERAGKYYDIKVVETFIKILEN